MKKIFKLLALTFSFAFIIVLASCSKSNVSEEYANNINSKAESKEFVTYSQVCEDLKGETFIGATLLNSTNGFIICVEGKDLTDEKDVNKIIKENNGKNYIWINILNNSAISATFGVIEDDTKFE